MSPSGEGTGLSIREGEFDPRHGRHSQGGALGGANAVEAMKAEALEASRALLEAEATHEIKICGCVCGFLAVHRWCGSVELGTTNRKAGSAGWPGAVPIIDHLPAPHVDKCEGKPPMTPLSQTDAERYRREAQGCRELAEQCENPRDKEAWLQLAGDWLKLAQEAERRTKYQRG